MRNHAAWTTLLALSSAAQAQVLFGVTDAAGTATFCRIDQATGRATSLFEFPVSPGHLVFGLAFHEPTGTFLCGVMRPFPRDGPPRLGIIDPVFLSFREVEIAGMPPNEDSWSGLECHPAFEGFLVSFAPRNSVAEQRIAHLRLDGQVLDTTGILSLEDIDSLGNDRGRLVAADLNRPSSPRLFEIQNLFPSATFVPIGSPPPDGSVGDIAFRPADGLLHAVEHNSRRGALRTLHNDRYTVVGDFGLPVQVTGIAFGPPVCPPDCDRSTGPGTLDIFDFLCFQNRFDATDPYACDCDTSSGPGVCDIFDFLCFQNAFAAGCP